jgi:hypothetical protein
VANKIVLAHQHDGTGAVPRLDRRLVIGQRRKCRLLDDDVLAGGQRFLGQPQMEDRRHGDHDGVHRRVGHRGPIVTVTPHAAVPAAERVRARPITAGIAQPESGSARLKHPAVHPGDEPTPEEREAEGSTQVP